MLRYFKMTIVLLAITLVACQSTSPAQPKRVDSTPVENLNINMLDMSYAPAKLDVAHAGRYSVKVTNTITVPHDIVFSNGVGRVVVNNEDPPAAQFSRIKR